MRDLTSNSFHSSLHQCVVDSERDFSLQKFGFTLTKIFVTQHFKAAAEANIIIFTACGRQKY